jgi:hypothetical protein
MTPAQRRRRKDSFKKRGVKFRLRKVFISAFLILASLLFIVFNTKYWHTNQKLILVINTPKGDLAVTAFDPTQDEITTVTIPGSTQLDVARGLGSWKAKSIAKLGENEKLGGALMKDTLIKNFSFPVVAWAGAEAYGYATGEAIQVLKAMLLPYKTNLKIGDKIRIGILSLGVKTLNRKDINLASSSYLKKVKLKDGEEGYEISGKIPGDLLIVFAEELISEKSFKVQIKDATGNGYTAKEVASTIEVLGAKVAAVANIDKASTDCEVKSIDALFGRKINELFGCELGKGSPEGQFDLEIGIGEAFAKRF